MKKFLKCGIAFSLALLSLMLVACGCSKNMEPYATVTRTPDNTGGSNLSFSYNTDTHTAWFGGEELRLTTYNSFAASMRTALRTQMSAFFVNITNVENGVPAKRDSLISTYTKNLEDVKKGAII